MSKMFEDLKDTLKQELRALSRKEMTKESLDTIYKLSESLKAVQTIEAMEEAGGYSQGGYSQERGYSRHTPMESYNNMSNDRGGSYEGGSYEGSYNRGSYEGGSYNNSGRGSYDGRKGRDGDNDGRYSETPNASHRNYSRNSSKEQMIKKMETMLNEASNEKEREAIMRCIEQLEY